MSTLSERLSKARGDAGLSQAALAKLAGCGQSTIASIERGRNQGSTVLPRLAELLGVSAIWLAEGRGLPRPNASTKHSPDETIADPDAMTLGKPGKPLFCSISLPGVLPQDPKLVTKGDLEQMNNDLLPEFRLECEHDLPAEAAGDLAIAKGHYAIMDSTVEHQPRDIVLARLPDARLVLRRVVRMGDGQTYLVGDGEGHPLPSPDAILAVAIGSSTPRLTRRKKR